jgi:hypothetical protein
VVVEVGAGDPDTAKGSLYVVQVEASLADARLPGLTMREP